MFEHDGHRVRKARPQRGARTSEPWLGAYQPAAGIAGYALVARDPEVEVLCGAPGAVVQMLHVDPAERGTGVAMALLRRVIEWADRQQLTLVAALAPNAERTPAMARVAKRYGFAPRLHDVAVNPSLEAVVYRPPRPKGLRAHDEWAPVAPA